MRMTINALVEGGKATAGPPLGPALGPLGVNIVGIIDEINKKTAAFKGITVPVKVHVEKETKKFEVEIGIPQTSALIKKELGVEKGAKAKGEVIGNLSLEQVLSIAKIKKSASLGKNLKEITKEILGTCVSLGVTCEGKGAKETIKEIKEGKHNGKFKE